MTALRGPGRGRSPVKVTRQGFGTRLIETLGRQLKGDVKLTYQPSGLVYVFDVPLTSLAPSAAE